ncbi:hypothetical protein BCR39DRAFT_529326 [Naematelia encephala]|uniref:Uncharacterized protein n=1 Tax=Naematelia encephala TaxID=71784 RepID=A0A1Y2B682_9TREE|nr:hypothetical protein BCR39DRAFT_529326 [Naematelia encephala]
MSAAARVTRYKDTQPLKSLAKASQSCSAPGMAYGKCIGAKYTEVSKGMCEAEFQAFKDCVQKSFGRKW